MSITRYLHEGIAFLPIDIDVDANIDACFLEFEARRWQLGRGSLDPARKSPEAGRCLPS